MQIKQISIFLLRNCDHTRKYSNGSKCNIVTCIYMNVMYMRYICPKMVMYALIWSCFPNKNMQIRWNLHNISNLTSYGYLFSANWNNEHYGLASIYRALLLTLEKLISDEDTQINGFVIIVDWSQFSFKQSTWINPKILKLMIEGLQVG